MTHPLLTPRYIVEADYPNSPFRVGDVLHRHVYLESDETYYVYAKVPDNFNIVIHDYVDDDVIVKCHKVFRKMHWSEGRELSEMPRWVKDKETGKVIIKVHAYQLIAGEWWFISEANKDIHHVTSLSIFTPATEAEYLEYLKSKEK